MKKVTASREALTIPTYDVGTPEKNPMFFEKRVYQGSCGKVYPVPFIDKVYDDKEDKDYDSVRLENEYIRLVMLPEIGGRIYIGQDKTNEDYNFFYKNDVIKPALVGLAGPWLSGGVEFNWPQHHRPGTFMPADVEIEEDEDGAKTVWLSEHDPINRLKGMHGIRIRPGSSLIELRARLFNRTPQLQTFLWWANVAAEVHENYQSFFPTDVHHVADHAARAMSSFPEANNYYYGLDYHNRPGANDLSWYKNITVPTSYMVYQTDYDFFGGYDHDADGGFIHVANRHISPGKKQWTWGNHEFGWAWDRELTDDNGPYIELMAGVYTDNQPDFTYLQPYETKTFSQYWWSYKNLGPVQNASDKVAIRLVVTDDGTIDMGLASSEIMENVRVVLRDKGDILLDEKVNTSPDNPWQNKELKFAGTDYDNLECAVFDANGEFLLCFRPVIVPEESELPDPAKEPAAPKDISSVEELYLTGEHLEQYRHPTCYPEIYWEEALKRDPKDVRSNIALGRQSLQRGNFSQAGDHFATAMGRLTQLQPNPETGEAHYYAGLTAKLQGHLREAYPLFYKSIWNNNQRAAGYYQLATLDCCRGDYDKALEHLQLSLTTNTDNNKAHVLQSVILRNLGQADFALKNLELLLEVDRLDHWALYEKALLNADTSAFMSKSRNDAQTVLDLVFDYAAAGFNKDALALLELHESQKVSYAAVPNPLKQTQMVAYTKAWLLAQNAQTSAESEKALQEARAQKADYLFPSRLEEMIVLEWALSMPGADRNAAYGLGNLYFDRKRHEDAISAWEKCQSADPSFATVSRNLGIAYWNVRSDAFKARAAYEQALAADPADGRILFEYDQLCKKIGDPAEQRLKKMLAHEEMVLSRDDSCVALAELFNQTGEPAKALDLVLNHRFHPWEGGEGQVLRQYTNARLLLGQQALKQNQATEALKQFELAMDTPHNLGEAYHELQAKADVNYWIGKAHKAAGNSTEAAEFFEKSANEQGDFQAMAVTEHSELSYYRGLSLIELGRDPEAGQLFEGLKAFAEQLLQSEAKIDYFATSLPLLLVFEDDLQKTQDLEAKTLIKLAEEGLEQLASHKLEEVTS